MWTRCCLACWPKGYRNTCEESWGRRFRIGVRALRGLQEFLRVRERRRAGWPPPGERCSGSTSSERTADVSPAAGDAAGRRVVPRVSAPRGAQESGWPGAGCRCGAPRSCARCGRSRWRTSSAGCRAGSDSRLRALRRFLAALAGSKVVSGALRAAERPGGLPARVRPWPVARAGAGIRRLWTVRPGSRCRVWARAVAALASRVRRDVPGVVCLRPRTAAMSRPERMSHSPEGRRRPSVADHGSTAGFPGLAATLVGNEPSCGVGWRGRLASSALGDERLCSGGSGRWPSW